MKITNKQKQTAQENLNFYKNLLNIAKEDVKFDEETLRICISKRFPNPRSVDLFAYLFGVACLKAGINMEKDFEYPLNHDSTIKAFTFMVESFQKDFDSMEVEDKITQ